MWIGFFVILVLIIVFIISYNLVKFYGVDGLLVGIILFGVLIIFMLIILKEGGLNLVWIGV